MRIAGVCGMVIFLVALRGTVDAQRDYSDTVRQLIDRGRYAEAESLAFELAKTAERDLGSESAESSRRLDLLVEALVRNGKATDPETLALAERALHVKFRALGPGHPETAVSLHNIGAVRASRAEFAEALAMHERALSLRRATLQPTDPALADSLDHVTSILISMNRFSDADRHLSESLRIRESMSDDPRALARTLELQATLQRYSGQFAKAIEPAERARVWI